MPHASFLAPFLTTDELVRLSLACNERGTASVVGVWINNIPTQDEMCSWFTYSTPDANKQNVVQANSSMGPMYANINTTIKAFESRNCQPWTPVQ